MGKVGTPINGITTRLNYDDGDTLQCVNLRKRHGSLYPVSPRRVMKYVEGEEEKALNIDPDMDIVFVHKTPDYENWIGVKNDDNGTSQILWIGSMKGGVFERENNPVNAAITKRKTYIYSPDLPNVTTNKIILYPDTGADLIFYLGEMSKVEGYDLWRAQITLATESLSSDIPSGPGKFWDANMAEEFSYTSIEQDIVEGSDIVECINSIEQTGNIISFISDTLIYYAFFKDSRYVFLGVLPELPVIQFHTVPYSIEKSGRRDYGLVPAMVDNENNLVFSIDSNKAIIYRMMEDLKKENSDSKRPAGVKLFDAHYIRYAFRLYDGSHIKFSPPLLIIPNSRLVGDSEGAYSAPNSCTFFRMTVKELPIEIPGADVKITVNQNSEIEFEYTVWGYVLRAIYDLTLDGSYEDWKDIIKSVDIFMSPALGINSPENYREDFFGENAENINKPTHREKGATGISFIDGILPTKTVWSTDVTGIVNKYYSYVVKLSDSANDRIKNTSNFYLIKSIPLGETVLYPDNISLPDDTLNVNSINDIVQLEELGNDSFSHNYFGGKISRQYNGRLHVANLKSSFFRGFKYDFFAVHSNYNGIEQIWPKTYIFKVVVNVEIELDGGQTVTVQSVSNSLGVANSSAFISYPDSRARRMIIYYRNGNNEWYKKEYPLIAHDFLNIAYYVNPDLRPVAFIGSDAKVPEPEILNDNAIASESVNVIKVSELNNPFYFPNQNTYTVGTVGIMGLATVAQRISEGSFGQYPLYVFTDTGVYSLQVGTGDVLYERTVAPTSYEVPTNGSAICETAMGVVFASKRGLAVIFGQEVKIISEAVNQPPRRMEIEWPSQIEGVMHDAANILIDYPDRRDFADYLANIENIVYDPKENEIILVERDYPAFNFVYNLDSGQWYLSDSRISNVVRNVFPELYVIERLGEDSGILRDYSKPETDDAGRAKAHVSFITRGLRYGTEEVKRLERMILRGTFFRLEGISLDPPVEDVSLKRPVAVLWRSLDGVNFRVMRGVPMKVYTELGESEMQGQKDLDMGLMVRSEAREFMLGFAGVMDETGRIDVAESTVIIDD